MHPNTFFANLFNQDRRDEVFIVMSFAAEFNSTWTDIIEPAVRDAKLEPKRVDFNQSGESVVHDILDGLAHSRLVLADITCSLMRDRQGTIWPQRNGNVMWEVGVAHTMRVPEEVILVRADNEPSIFDLTQFRAFPYDSGDVPTARTMVGTILLDRLRSIDLQKAEHVKRCARSLDFASWWILLQHQAALSVPHPVIRTMGDVMGNISVLPAISRLLEMGALATSFVLVTPQAIHALADQPMERMCYYRITPLGQAVFACISSTMGLPNLPTNPDLHAAIDAVLNKGKGSSQQ